VLLNVRVSKRFDPAAVPQVATAVAEAQARLAGAGRIVLRPSGTEPLIRVMVEGREEPLARACAERIAEAVRAASP
jgi:phosphoglucosamine mutase